MGSDATDGDSKDTTEPTPQQVLAAIDACEPYTVSDLTDEFDASRWTIQRRLDTLVDDGELSKKKHSENRVSYFIDDTLNK